MVATTVFYRHYLQAPPTYLLTLSLLHSIQVSMLPCKSALHGNQA